MICCKNIVDITFLSIRNDMSITFLQQILSDKLLLVIIIGISNNYPYESIL